MPSSFSCLLVLLALLTAACSGGRDDALGGQCVTDRQCASGGRCVTGMCLASDSASATGRVAGAPDDVQVETRGDEAACEDRGSSGVVCVLGAGDAVTLIAPEVEGYRFTNWSGSAACTGSESELALTKLQGSVTCTANYVKRVTVRGEVSGEGGATIIASSEGEFADCAPGSCVVDAESVVVLQAPARDGLRLTDFEGPGCGERDGYRVTVHTAEDDVLCTATYVTSLTVRGLTSGLGEQSSKPEAEVKASSPWAGAQCDGPLCSIDGGQTVVLTAPDVGGFRFRGWLGDPACVGSEQVLTVSEVSSNVTCTADYVARYTVRGLTEGATAEITARSDNLFSTCDGARCEVDSGESVTLIAGVVDGYRLEHWSGEGCAAQPGAAVLAAEVQADTTCTAHYVEGVSVSGTLVNAAGSILATSSSPGARCEPGSCSIDIGGSVKLSAPSVDGRTFLGWSGGEGCTGTSLTITLQDVQTSRACKATYAARYTVGAVARPSAGGSISAASSGPNSRCASGTCQVDEGSTVTLTAQAAASYRFTGWNGGGPCAGFGPQLVVPNVANAVTCTANFVLRISVRGEASPRAGGSVTASQLSPSAVCSGDTCVVDADSNVTLTATASTGYEFVSWSGCGSPLNPLAGLQTLPVLGASEDTVCTANFQKLIYPVSAQGSTGGSATASLGVTPCAGGVCQVPYGEGATLSALPSEGYDFAGWTGGCSGGPTTTVDNVQAAVTCTATFSLKPVTLTGVATGAAGAPAPVGSCGAGACTTTWGGSVSFTAAVDPTRYRFDGWTCAGGTVSGASGEVITVTNLRQNQTCSASYSRRNLVTVLVSGSPQTGTAGCTGSCWVDPGGSLSIQAAPAQSYLFGEWRCGSEGAPTASTPRTDAQYANPRTLTPGADITCTATFYPVLL